MTDPTPATRTIGSADPTLAEIQVALKAFYRTDPTPYVPEGSGVRDLPKMKAALIAAREHDPLRKLAVEIGAIAKGMASHKWDRRQDLNDALMRLELLLAGHAFDVERYEISERERLACVVVERDELVGMWMERAKKAEAELAAREHDPVRQILRSIMSRDTYHINTDMDREWKALRATLEGEDGGEAVDITEWIVRAKKAESELESLRKDPLGQAVAKFVDVWFGEHEGRTERDEAAEPFIVALRSILESEVNL